MQLAAAGDLDRAEALAQSITDPDQRVKAVARLAEAMAYAGDVECAHMLAERAEALARVMTIPSQQAKTAADLARVVAAAGDLDRARMLAERADTLAR